MDNKKYFSLLAITGIAASFVFAVPAFASTSGTSSDQASGKWRGNQEDRQPGVFGRVTAISGTTITITEGRENKTYTIDASGATFTKDGTSSSISNIAVGDTIMVEGTISGTSIAAVKINSGTMGRGPGNGKGDEKGRGVKGTVSSISGNTLTVKGKTGPGAEGRSEIIYTVDASNATVKKDGATSTVSSIAEGDTVMVRGTVSGTNITATSIDDGVLGKGQGGPQDQTPIVEGDGQPMIAGTVVSISGSTISVTNKSNITYTIDASSAIVKKEGTENATVSNIAAGDSIVAQGAVNGTSMTASSVIDQTVAAADSSTSDNPGNHAGFFGNIFNFFKHLFGF